MTFLRWLASFFLPPTPAPIPEPTPTPVPPPTPTPPPAPAPPGVVDALNAERAREQQQALRSDDRLAAMAQAWAEEMAQENTMTHGDFSQRITAVYPNTLAAENIAAGASTVDGAVALWMNSRPHRENVLGPFTIAGAGQSTSESGTTYWCVDFAAPNA